LVSTHVTMLLPIGHDNTQFTRVTVNRMLLSVHWPEAEHGCSCYVILKRRDHQRQILRGRPPSQWELSKFAGSGCISLTRRVGLMHRW